ncbi:cytochrome c biogenesis protein CcsA [Halomonas sp. HP20-15]|uniref:cytochrome C assembly family protein n=1 Tax=Halomonas sp. HP20-15 TaxID=3085901 RepID=UPI0029817BC5|nr:cytochrome c biogenesis protein CcsA [Halomonas sp. HP20-15]MDW5376245.1 cytochrome c biogenesis protein CcsA [Halomonas sp. HP20-15]
MQAFPFAILAMVFYVAGGVCQGLALTRRVPPHPILVRALGVLAVACHSVVVTAALDDLGELSLGISASASLVSWLVAILILLTSLFKPVLSAAVALFPIAAATVLLATELPVGSHRAGLTPGIMVHILTSIVAFAVFAIAAVQAFLMARQNQALRHHHTRGLVQSLPPLTTMERVLFELIWVGMVLLTAAIVSGVVFLDNLFAQHLVHKTVLSFAAWVIFATLLAGRHFLGWRGNRAARWTLGGCALLLLAYFGSKFALEVVFDRV